MILSMILTVRSKLPLRKKGERMYVEIDNARIFVSTGGRDLGVSDTAAPTILFLHGSGQSHLTWLLQARFFANRGFGVVAPDLPAHGLSGGVALTSIEAMADWCASLMRALGIKKAVAVGHSQGGLVALELAKRHSAHIAGLGLIATAAAIAVNDALIAMADNDEPAAFDAMTAWGHGRMGAFHDHSMPGNSHIHLGRRIMGQNPRGVLAADLRACAAYSGGMDAAASVLVPALVLLAGADRMTPPELGQKLAEAISGAKAAVIAGAGHLVPLEYGDEVNRYLRALFADIEAAA